MRSLQLLELPEYLFGCSMQGGVVFESIATATHSDTFLVALHINLNDCYPAKKRSYP